MRRLTREEQLEFENLRLKDEFCTGFEFHRSDGSERCLRDCVRVGTRKGSFRLDCKAPTERRAESGL